MEDDIPDQDEVFDRQVGHILDTQAPLLREQTAALLATGSASLFWAGARVQARLRLPRWWRPGRLEISREDPAHGSTGSTGSSLIPLGRSHWDRDFLRREITLQLAVMLADDEPGPELERGAAE